MKYFKYELWEAMNSEDSTEEEKASEQWEINDKQYFNEFIQLESKVSKELFQVFKQIRFHDFVLKNYSITQYESDDPKQIEVTITVSDDFSEEWELKYKDVRKFAVQVQYESNYDMGDWGYSEIFVEVDGVISHEILLSTGTTILIHFTDITLSKISKR
ncbi:hypothetical protein ACFSTH_09485 [Paenibacillus yanchengensis]|uniref:DUF4085 family protein n=1 Tax=Paenibacillus yanchengensis TaxID=2035833 RepID=A0ABW4YPJ9_9BACL